MARPSNAWPRIRRSTVVRSGSAGISGAGPAVAAPRPTPAIPTLAGGVASSTILLPRFNVVLVKSSVSKGTFGRSRKSSVDSKFTAIASNTASRSRGFTSRPTTTNSTFTLDLDADCIHPLK